MKKYIICVIKIFVALLTSIVILSFILSFYGLTPVHKHNTKGNTDYVWPGNSYWIKASEGIAWGKYDANGYNNLKVIDNPDILITGSSHMEATNIMQKETVAAILNDHYGEKHRVYNVGISGHNIYKSTQYLPDNIKLFNTSKYIFVETSNVTLKKESVENVINHKVKYTPSHDKGLVGMLQRVPFLRILYQQKEHGLIKLFMPNTAKPKVVKKESVRIDLEAYDKLFAFVKRLQDDHNVKIVYFYHPTETIMDNGKIKYDNSESLKIFKKYAVKYGVGFIDLSDTFEKAYYKEHVVPHGFVTGKLGTGHINAHGHRLAAMKIIEYIDQREEAGK